MGDEQRPRDGTGEEHPDERGYRHAIEGRMQFATVQSLAELKDEVKDVKRTSDANAAALTLVRTIIEGHYDPTTGVRIPGMLDTINDVRRLLKYGVRGIQALLGIGAANAIGIWARHFIH